MAAFQQLHQEGRPDFDPSATWIHGAGSSWRPSIRVVVEDLAALNAQGPGNVPVCGARKTRLENLGGEHGIEDDFHIAAIGFHILSKSFPSRQDPSSTACSCCMFFVCWVSLPLS